MTMTWTELNERLKTMTRVADVLALFETEKARGRPRKPWLRRIYSRLSVLRRKEEREALKL